jgi:hypothetical protein
VAEGLTTALNLQKPLISDLHGQGVEMVLTLKMACIVSDLAWVQILFLLIQNLVL